MAVQVKLPSRGNRTFEAEIVTLPATVKLPAPKTPRLGGFIVGAMFTIIGYMMFRDGLAQSGINLNALIGLGLGSYGGLTIAKTILAPKGQTTMQFSENHVTIKVNGWLRPSSWQEPLKAYEGIKHRTKPAPGNGPRPPYQIIELIHSNTSKTLPLYAARSEKAPIDHLEHYADVLDVEIIQV